MRNLFWILALILPMLLGYSCSKRGVENNLLIGQWTIVNDSSSNVDAFYSLQAEDSGIVNGNYLGISGGDYFNFNSNGNLTTLFFTNSFAWPLLDSAKYTITNNQVKISIYFITQAFSQPYNNYINNYINPFITRTYSIRNLTANFATLIFQSPIPSPKGATETEIINLKK